MVVQLSEVLDEDIELQSVVIYQLFDKKKSIYFGEAESRRRTLLN
jgi:hypothetical protein